MWVENFRVNSFNFGWVDFRENGEKKRVENRRENGWKWGLVGRGVRRENWGLTVFFSDPSKFSFHKIWRKWEKKKGKMRVGQNYHSPPLSQLFVFFLHFVFPFFLFSFFTFFFLVDKISSCLHFAQYVHIGLFCLFLYVLFYFFILLAFAYFIN